MPTPWILAIDFGTSYTVAAVRVEGRSPEVIDVGGSVRMPSVVLAEDPTHVLVGEVAEELSAAQPASTLRTPKNRLGDAAPVVLGGRPYQVEVLVAELLRTVYEQAVTRQGSPPTEVRLTHPATWNRPRLNRLVEAAAKAGIAPTVLVAEPVAAAMAYANEVGVSDGDTVAVYDLGGGTFDSAVVTAVGGSFSIVGRPGGDPSIGGELFDELLANELGSRLDPGTWEAIQVAEEPQWRQAATMLRRAAKRAKETLSSHPYADVVVPLPAGITQLRITRDEYEELIAPYIEETVALLARCVDAAAVEPSELAAIYLVGGTSRTPIVERLVKAAFPGVAVSRRGDPKTSTAFGATLAILGSSPVAAGSPPDTEDVAARTADEPLVLGVPPGTPAPPSPPPAPSSPTPRPPDAKPRGRCSPDARPRDVAGPLGATAAGTAGWFPPPALTGRADRRRRRLGGPRGGARRGLERGR